MESCKYAFSGRLRTPHLGRGRWQGVPSARSSLPLEKSGVVPRETRISRPFNPPSSGVMVAVFGNSTFNSLSAGVNAFKTSGWASAAMWWRRGAAASPGCLQVGRSGGRRGPRRGAGSLGLLGPGSERAVSRHLPPLHLAPGFCCTLLLDRGRGGPFFLNSIAAPDRSPRAAVPPARSVRPGSS